MSLFSQILKKAAIFCLMFSVAQQGAANEALVDVKKNYHHDPFLTIELLKNIKQANLTEAVENFELDELLILLYIKTEQYAAAEQHLLDLKQTYSIQENFQSKIALLDVQLMLHSLNSDKVLQVLAPFEAELKVTEDRQVKAKYLTLLAAYLIRQGDFSQAMEHLTIALEQARQMSLNDLEYSIKNQLVQIFYNTKQYHRGLELTEEMIASSKLLNDQFALVTALSNKMNLFYALSVELASQLPDEVVLANLDYQHYTQQSHQLQEEVLALSRKIKAYRSELRSMIIQQNRLLTENQLQQSLAVGEQVVALSKRYQMGYEGAVAANNNSIALRLLGDYKKSIEFLKLAEDYYLKINHLQSLSWIYEDYAKTHQLAGDFKSALYYFEKYHDAWRKQVNRSHDQKLLELQEKFTVKEKAQEINRLTQKAALDARQLENERLGRWLLTVNLLALFVIAMVLFYKRQRLTQLLKKQTSLHQQIIEISRAKQRFFSNLSHEFRTALTLSIAPLRSILKNRHAQDDLKQDTVAGLTQDEQLASIETALENNLHMLGLLNEVADLEKLDANKMPINLAHFNLKHTIDYCIRRFQLQFEENSIRVKKHCFDTDTRIYFDPSHFEKIIANILSNSAKYAEPDSLIDIRLIDRKHEIVIEISDTGPGISEQELPLLFRRFYQGYASTEKKLPGTGVGLALVKELIELHHGRVKISSQKGQGCCVKLYFKKGMSHYSDEQIAKLKHQSNTSSYFNSRSNFVNDKDLVRLDKQDAVSVNSESFNSELLEADPSHSKQFWKGNKHSADPNSHASDNTPLNYEPESTIKAAQYKKVILVVDDNTAIRQLIRSELQSEFHIVEAKDGAQGLKIAESIQPDLMIIDVMMPKMDGFQLTESLRNNPALAHLSILLLTALSDTEQKVRGLKLGANDYMTKPFDSDELKARVKAHLHNKQLLSKALIRQYGKHPQSALSVNQFVGKEAKRSQKLDRLIAENLSKWEFDVEQMYSALNMTRSSLYRYTQKVFGCTPMNLLKKRRLELAHKMLLEYTGTISEIAYAVGYQSLSAFSRAFREYYHYPPTKVKSDLAVKSEETVKAC